MQECIFFYNNSNALPLFLKVYLAQRKKKSVNLLNLMLLNLQFSFFFGPQKFTGHFYSCDHCFKHQKECRSRIQVFLPHSAVKALAITLRATEPETLSNSLQCTKQNLLLQKSCSRQENSICLYALLTVLLTSMYMQQAAFSTLYITYVIPHKYTLLTNRLVLWTSSPFDYFYNIFVSLLNLEIPGAHSL